MSDRFEPIPIDQLLRIILNEYSRSGSIFGISEDLFFNPLSHQHLNRKQFGQTIYNPVGVAAGPHTQMAQNIVVAWLMGARFIELKTVQTLDELEVPKPCIDMQDEGYNCEWSQELRLSESYDEYLKAWIVIHLLNHKLFGKIPAGTIFNMSAGYDLRGIMNDNMQWFFSNMNDCSGKLKEYKSIVKAIYPDIESIEIPSCISDNITLSTMHGCPPDEIESIASYLITEKRLHTYVKLNPTLLGAEKLREILNKKSGFKTIVPDIAFEHDLKYPDALKLIHSLTAKAKAAGVEFGLKLTNTLESVNNKDLFEKDIEMMYMSGRALHPIAVNLAAGLQREFNGELNISFSAGADAFNLHKLMSCGFRTVTVCSDLLKPGGYTRLKQYFEETEARFREKGASSVDDYIRSVGNQANITESSLYNLNHYAAETLESKAYHKDPLEKRSIKGNRPLAIFDCISAPCVENCATGQEIPEYLYFTGKGSFHKAFETILRTNPFPSVTGMVCDHLCQTRCTRINYDSPVLIREVKRFVAEQEDRLPRYFRKIGVRVAIIGAGPSGLSCAYYLGLHHFNVDIFEEKDKAGGMARFAIPGFRLTEEAINKDIERIESTGVRIHYGVKVDPELFAELKAEYDYVYVAVGAQLSAELKLEGTNGSGVLDPLKFLFNARAGKESGLGKNVIIIGGGNSAMDAARTAFRLVPPDGRVTLVYRRTISEMPADKGEIRAVIDEGIEIVELASPVRVIMKEGKLSSLVCRRMKIEGTDSSGRPSPIPVEGSDFEIPCDTIIPAIGQAVDLDFLNGAAKNEIARDYTTAYKNVFIGGDAMRGAATAIKAIGDGRRVAGIIVSGSEIPDSSTVSKNYPSLGKKELMMRRSRRVDAITPWEPDLDDRKNFRLISRTLDSNDAINEARRCLHCDQICNICTTVCPNMANYAFTVRPAVYEIHTIKVNKDGKVEITAAGKYKVGQETQILNIANFCNECGNCTTFCPTSGSPYREKPHLHLTRESFEKATEGFFAESTKNGRALYHKNNGYNSVLTSISGGYLFETGDLLVSLNMQCIPLDVKTTKNSEFETSTEEIVEMAIILEGAASLLPLN